MGIYGHCKRVPVDELHEMQQCQDVGMLVTLLDLDYDWPERAGYTWSDKCFQVINDILNHDCALGEPPILDITEAGTPIGDFWIGYGPLRYLLPEELQQIVERLKQAGWKRTLEDITCPRRAVEIYEPAFQDVDAGWDEEFPFSYEDMAPPSFDSGEVMGLESCKQLVRILGAAAYAGDAVLFWIS
jgi:hypothetical protein